MINTPKNQRLEAFTTASPLRISCQFCNGHPHTNADFTICMQCGLEQTPSEQWRLELR